MVLLLIRKTNKNGTFTRPLQQELNVLSGFNIVT